METLEAAHTEAAMSDRSAIQRAQWADPIIRANRLSAMRAEDVRVRQTTRMKARWADPDERERMIAMIRRAMQTAKSRVVWTAEMTQALRDLRGHGMSLADTAERIGVSQKILRRQMGLLGMPTSDQRRNSFERRSGNAGVFDPQHPHWALRREFDA